MFHLLKWRERMYAQLSALRECRPHTHPPQNVNEFNDAQLAGASLLSLHDTASRADALVNALQLTGRARTCVKTLCATTTSRDRAVAVLQEVTKAARAVQKLWDPFGPTVTEHMPHLQCG